MISHLMTFSVFKFMTTSNQFTPGMTISIDGKIYRVESCVKVTVAKGVPFIKTKLKDLLTDEVIEKNFKLNQPIQDVHLTERRLEFLYLEGKDYLFLDIGNLRTSSRSCAMSLAIKSIISKKGSSSKRCFMGIRFSLSNCPNF